MITRPTRPIAGDPTPEPGYAQPIGDFSPEPALQTVPVRESTPPAAALRHGPVPRKRWAREHRR